MVTITIGREKDISPYKRDIRRKYVAVFSFWVSDTEFEQICGNDLKCEVERTCLTNKLLSSSKWTLSQWRSVPPRKFLALFKRSCQITTLIGYDIFNCSWVDSRWQLFSTHIRINNTESDTKQTIHRTTQKYIEQHKKYIEQHKN